jgi:hypothetical protein|tara:strand:- start:178 stop:4986 length:4809 start_codon:yes stop_codon:yes gene_type:complete
MAKNNEIIIKLRIDDKGNLKKSSAQVEKLSKSTDKAAKSTDKLSKSRDKYNRTEKGVAGISSNSTKNFSKMQQSIGGDGGSGGLVRAYALLAANVFALTAAFGVLSRASQVEVLIESIERLETVTGKSVTAVARDLQGASRGALDFASSLRSVSLASSAGFNSSQIQELGEVATNASVALGRNLADGLDRIFRGVIKVEPELLDEIGLFVRVNEAATKYAARLGVAATDLTEFQRRQAFANEAIEQGQRKFSVFNDIQPAALDRLSASLLDLSQAALGIVTGFLEPILNFALNNTSVLVGAFGGIVFALLRQVVPALGVFALNASASAQAAKDAFEETETKITEGLKQQISADLDLEQQQLKRLRDVDAANKKASADAPQFGAKKMAAANKALDNAKTTEERITALKQKQNALSLSKNTKDKIGFEQAEIAIANEIKGQEAILASEREISRLKKEGKGAQQLTSGPLFEQKQKEAIKLERAMRVERISSTAATKGLSAGLAQLQVQTIKATGANMSFTRSLFTVQGAAVAARGAIALMSVAVSRLMAAMGPFLLLVTILPAAFDFFKKMVGLTTENTEKFNEAAKKSSELVEKLNEKLKQTAKTLADEGLVGEQQAKAIESQAQAFAETAESLIETRARVLAVFSERSTIGKIFSIGAVNELQEEQEFLKEVIESGNLSKAALAALNQAGFDTSNINEINTKRAQANAQLKIQADALNEINKIEKEIATNKDLDDAAINKKLKLIKEQNKIIIDAKNEEKGLNKDIEKLTKEIFSRVGSDSPIKDTGQAVRIIGKESRVAADNMANLQSAIDGSRDAADDFRKGFITKTVVDKPLASIIAITNSLDKQSTSNEKLLVGALTRAKQLEAIAKGQNGVLDLMNKERQEAFKTAKTEEERLAILREVKKEFFEQQKILGRNKQLIQEQSAEQKLFKDANKLTTSGIQMTNLAKQRQLALEKETLEVSAEQAFTASNLTESQFKALQLAEEEGRLEEALTKLTTNRGNAMKALNTARMVEIKNLEIELESKLGIKKVEEEQLQLELKTVASQEKLNDALATQAKLRAQAENVARGRGKQLSKGKELELELQTFVRGTAATNERFRIETRIAKLKVESLDIEVAAQQKIFKMRMDALIAESEARSMEDPAEQALRSRAEQLKAEGLDATDFATQMDNSIQTLATNLGNSARAILLNLNDLSGIFQLPQSDIVSVAERLGDEIGARTGPAAIAAAKEARQRLVKERDAARERGDTAEVDRIGKELKKFDNKFNEDGTLNALGNITLATTAAAGAVAELSKGFEAFGPDGKVAAALGHFSATALASIDAFAGDEPADKIAAVGQMLGGIAGILTANSDRQISNIDKQIDAEKKRDGKSKESIQKIKQMEAQKEQIAKKSFETNKKLQMAQTVINTAAAIVGIMASTSITGPAAIALAAAVGAMGAAQLALISRTQYEGGGATETAAAAPTNLSIGDRGNEVNVSNQANRGELAYLRGEKGVGNISNFAPAAAGRKGYAMGSEGVVVGERGPEVITPSMPIDITPNDKIGGGTTNVNFTIHAVDAAGLEQTIQSQRGNIIGMIREAANGYGENFLEQVDIDTLDTTGGSY